MDWESVLLHDLEAGPNIQVLDVFDCSISSEPHFKSQEEFKDPLSISILLKKMAQDLTYCQGITGLINELGLSFKCTE